MEEDKARELCEWLLTLIGIAATIKATESNDYIYLDIETEEAGLLIGRGGQTLDALETILNLIFVRKNPDGPRLSLDVSAFRKKREEQLSSLARDLAQKVREEGQEQKMASLTARERRIVHLALAQDEGVTTESVGEGEARTLIIKKRET